MTIANISTESTNAINIEETSVKVVHDTSKDEVREQEDVEVVEVVYICGECNQGFDMESKCNDHIQTHMFNLTVVSDVVLTVVPLSHVTVIADEFGEVGTKSR